MTLAPRPESATEARRALDAVLRESRLEALLDNALLLTSELVTNAVLHARTSVDVIFIVEAPRLRVEVSDDDERRPEPRDATGEDTSGRGLMLVDALASAWGVKPREQGKCVWFEVVA